jgi:DNA repair protein RadC
VATGVTAGSADSWSAPEDGALWSRSSRPAARQLTNHELLTRVLDGDGGTGARIASRFLSHFGSLRGLAGADPGALRGIPGVAAADALRLEACIELGRRLGYGRPLRRRRVDGPGDIARLVMPALRDADREHFLAVLLSTKNHVIDVVTVSVGSLSASIVHPREVWKPAIQASAAAIVVVHNHPTGVPAPSREDIELTRRLWQCGELIGIRLLDHVIVGDGTYESLKESGCF